MRVLIVMIALFGASQSAAPWQPQFERVQPELFAAPGGQANAWADADGDGDLDQFVAFRGRPNRLYRNDNGTFREVAAEVARRQPGNPSGRVGRLRCRRRSRSVHRLR